MENKFYLVSACLLGFNCRYDGKSFLNRRLLKQLQNKSIIAICPENLGGLPTPRFPAQIVGFNSNKEYSGQDVLKGKAKVISKSEDYTKYFINGSKQCELIIKKCNIIKSFLKAESPSCGYGTVYNRNKINGKEYLIKGNGVFADSLKQSNILVESI